MRHTTAIFTAFFTILSLVSVSFCHAHKVRIFAWAEGEMIHTESKFSGGKAVQNGTITVEDGEGGPIIFTGKTDEDGLFQFQAPDHESSVLSIIINSGDGHKGSWRYGIEESPATKTLSTPPTVSSVKAFPEDTRQNACISETQISELLDTALEAKLAPIRRSLAEQSEKQVSLQDILGGIGYILGLAGIVAYMKSAKQNS